MALVQKEFTDHELACQKIEQKMHLVTQKPLREGETVCALTGLAYDTVDRLRTFLNTDPEGVNTDFVSSLVRIDNVILGEDAKLVFRIDWRRPLPPALRALEKSAQLRLGRGHQRRRERRASFARRSHAEQRRRCCGVALGHQLRHGLRSRGGGGECWAAEPEARKGLARHDV